MKKKLFLGLGLGVFFLLGCTGEMSQAKSADCGDGKRKGGKTFQKGEECDDGNEVSGDGCSAICLIEEGFVCTKKSPSVCSPVCGDLLIAGEEECDDGNTASGDGCSSSCQSEILLLCGNGSLDPGELCDDGNLIDGDGCDASCVIELHCGNGLAEPSLGEECDQLDLRNKDCVLLGLDGGVLGCTDDCRFDTSGCANEDCANGIDDDFDGQIDCEDTGSCASEISCTCGDGVLDSNAQEECDGEDLGGLSCETFAFTGPGTLACTADCQRDFSGCFFREDCSDNFDNDEDGYQDCQDLECQSDPICYTGKTGAPCYYEADCIDGFCAGEFGGFPSGYCSGFCNVDSQCESGVCLGAFCWSTCATNEDCRAGYLCREDICVPGCTSDEECPITGYCRGNPEQPSHCEFVSCGDGVIQPLLGEECDDGNLIDGDGCNADCNFEICDNALDDDSDGTIDCDDADCLSFCTIEVCGDGLVRGDEECDDGNTLDNDGCNTFCQFEYCGDGVMQPSLGELCDDGNTFDHDGCNVNCIFEICDDAIDNDLDDITDCEDSDCFTQLVCTCGNGDINTSAGELCDGNNLAGLSCEDFGFEVGILTCDSQCQPRLSGCFDIENSCDDNADDDADGLFDCQDPDCQNATACLNGEDGDSCAQDADCLGGVCFEEVSDGFPSGLCSTFCNSQNGGAECNGGDFCFGVSCVVSCSTDADCRVGYICDPLFDFCNAHCTEDSQCPAAGFCDLQTNRCSTIQESCTGGLDEDGDSLVDCDDPDCAPFPGCAPLQELCFGGIDDDGDGLIDCDDPDCASSPNCIPPPPA